MPRCSPHIPDRENCNFLDPEYVESIVASTPSGMFTDRDIHGYWVAPEGVIYKDFNKDIHYISSEELEK